MACQGSDSSRSLGRVSRPHITAAWSAAGFAAAVGDEGKKDSDVADVLGVPDCVPPAGLRDRLQQWAALSAN